MTLFRIYNLIIFHFITEEFQPNQSSDDDEETIAKAEEEMKTTNHKEEVELLKKESEIPLEDLLKDLPSDYLEDRNKSLSPQNETIEEDQNVRFFGFVFLCFFFVFLSKISI